MRVFLSYAHEDRASAQVLASSLRQAGLDVYPGPHWPEEPKAAVRRADAFVVLLSPAATNSPFVDQEIKLALVTPHLADRMVPVILRQSDVPWVLEEMQPIRSSSRGQKTADAILARLKSPVPSQTR